MLDVSVRIGCSTRMATLRCEAADSFLYITHDIASARVRRGPADDVRRADRRKRPGRGRAGAPALTRSSCCRRCRSPRADIAPPRRRWRTPRWSLGRGCRFRARCPFTMTVPVVTHACGCSDGAQRACHVATSDGRDMMQTVVADPAVSPTHPREKHVELEGDRRIDCFAEQRERGETERACRWTCCRRSRSAAGDLGLGLRDVTSWSRRESSTCRSPLHRLHRCHRGRDRRRHCCEGRRGSLTSSWRETTPSRLRDIAARD